MHHQIARLVDHQDVAVFIDDIQRDILYPQRASFFNLSSMATVSPPSTFSFGLFDVLPLTFTRSPRIHFYARS